MASPAGAANLLQRSALWQPQVQTYLMTAPTAGATFTANSGLTYTANASAQATIEQQDFVDALANGWLPNAALQTIGAGVPVSVTDAAPGASQNNYAPAGYVGGATNRLIVTAAAGGTTLTGLSATGVDDGWRILIFNPSTTDSITFTNQSASSAAGNRFACPGNGDAALGLQTGALLNYVVNQWVFV